MSDPSRKRRDRYDVSGNVEAEYVDDEQTVLVNKKSIADLPTLQAEEERGLARAYEILLGKVRTDTPMTNALLLEIHSTSFGNLYSWAGRWRTVNISKPGITWPPALFVPQSMDAFERDTLRKHPAASLKDDDAFCAAVAEIQAEFLVVHPFREGNARTIKLLTDLLAAQTCRPLLDYDQNERGRAQYIHAASVAFRKDYGPMEWVIRQALAEGRNQVPPIPP